MTGLGVLRLVGGPLGGAGLGFFMSWASTSRLATWKVFCIVSVCFLFSLWLPQLYGPLSWRARGSRSAWRPRCPCWWAPCARA